MLVYVTTASHKPKKSNATRKRVERLNKMLLSEKISEESYRKTCKEILQACSPYTRDQISNLMLVTF